MSSNAVDLYNPSDIIAFSSRDAATNWCSQRDVNEMSCCTMPMVDFVDASNSSGVASYLYREPVTQRIFMMCNGDLVNVESCLLTCLIWKEKSLVCPPKVSKMLLFKADSSLTDVYFSLHTVGLLYESVMTTGMNYVEGDGGDTSTRECTSTSQFGQRPAHHSGRMTSGGEGYAAVNSRHWFSKDELIPFAPSNLLKSTSIMPFGDLQQKAQKEGSTADLWVVPTSDKIREMDHLILVLHPNGHMEEAMVKSATGAASGSQSSQPSHSRYNYQSHLKVLLYGTMSDFLTQNPKSMASVLDI